MFKNYYIKSLLIIISLLALNACKENDFSIEDRKTTEDFLISNFLNENNIMANKTESSIYYRTIQEGTQTLVGELITIGYQAWILDEDIFDQGTLSIVNNGSGQIVAINGKQEVYPANHARAGQSKDPKDRSKVIEGMIETLTLLHEGEQIRVYIPSHLAYKASGFAPFVPPNAILIFNIEAL